MSILSRGMVCGRVSSSDQTLKQVSTTTRSIQVVHSSRSLQQHLDLVCLVIERVHKMGLKLSHEKSVFLKDLTKESVNMLGFEVSHNTLRIPKDKMLALQKLEKPKNLKVAQSFIGSLVFYRNLLGTDILTCLNIVPICILSNGRKNAIRHL